MPERVALIVNPVAGEGHALGRWPAVERVLAERGEVVRVEPEGEHGMVAAIRAQAAEGRTIVVAGGDGTVNRAVNALDRWDVPLGLVPIGSGNDLARALGLPAEPVAAARRIVAGAAVPMDLVEVNGQRFCTVGGLGLLADVTMDVARLALAGRVTRPVVRGLGPYAYLLMTAVHLASPSSPTRTVRISGDGPDGPWRWDGECHAVLVANHPTFGAGLALPVPAQADDGVAEICIVPKCSRVSLALRLAALKTGRPQPEHVLTVRRARAATIDARQRRAVRGRRRRAVHGTAFRTESAAEGFTDHSMTFADWVVRKVRTGARGAHGAVRSAQGAQGARGAVRSALGAGARCWCCGGALRTLHRAHIAPHRAHFAPRTAPGARRAPCAPGAPARFRVGGQRGGVAGLVARHHDARAVARGHLEPGGLGDARAQRRILEQAQAARRHPREVVGVVEEARAAVVDDLRQAADARGHDRHLAGHRLERGEAEALLRGRQQEEVRHREHRHDVELLAEELRRSHQAGRGEPLAREVRVRAVADEQQARRHVRADAPEDLDDRVHPLDRAEVGHVHHEVLGAVQQLLPQVAATAVACDARSRGSSG